MGDDGAQQRRDHALRDGAGNGDPPDRQQFLEMELQPDAEHQQDDAELGELIGQPDVGDESRRVGADDNPGEQVADDGREMQALGEIAEDERRGEPADKRGDEVEAVHRGR